LVYLARIVLDHVARLAGNGGDLGIGAAGLEQEHNGRFAQAVEDEMPLTQQRQLFGVELSLP
jgi:hypothetical protein